MAKLKKRAGIIISSAALVALSAVLFGLHFLAFQNAKDLLFYTFMDIAFLPVQILLTGVIINSFITDREKRDRLVKMNMIVGIFFSEVGNGLLRIFAALDRNAGKIAEKVKIGGGWKNADFIAAVKEIRSSKIELDMTRADLPGLKDYLDKKLDFMARLLENNNLLEHENFTDLLWAVFHLAEELDCRNELSCIPPTDTEHLRLDIMRAYSLLSVEWMVYMRHLKNNYPFLFSLSARTNPFLPGSSATVY